MMYTVFNHLNTIGVYLKSKNFHCVFVSEGEFYVEEGLTLKTSFLEKSKLFHHLNYKMTAT